GVPFGGAVIGILGHDASELCLDVAGNIGIGTLVDGHAGGRVRNENMAHALRAACPLDGLGHPGGHIGEVGAAGSAYLKTRPAHPQHSKRDRNLTRCLTPTAAAAPCDCCRSAWAIGAATGPGGSFPGSRP